MARFIPLCAVLLIALPSCASMIVDGQHYQTGTEAREPLSTETPVEILTTVPPGAVVVGRVIGRAHVLEKGMAELKKHARLLGARAIANVKYERKFSADYLQDLFFIEGDAIVTK